MPVSILSLGANLISRETCRFSRSITRQASSRRIGFSENVALLSRRILIRVPLDLEQKRLGQYLAACDFDPGATSFCSALGVLHYLEDEMADDILRFVASLPPSSEIVFTFVLPEDAVDGVNLEIARRAAARTAELGEPWKSRVRPQALADKLKRLGFGEVFHLSPELAQARYFAGRSDKLAAPHWEQLISAVV